MCLFIYNYVQEGVEKPIARTKPAKRENETT